MFSLAPIKSKYKKNIGLPAPDPYNSKDSADFSTLEPAVIEAWHQIRTHYNFNRTFQDIYVFRLKKSNIIEFQNNCKKVFRHMDSYYCIPKIQISFSYLLKNRETGQERLYYASGNFPFLEVQTIALTKKDQQTILNEFNNTNVLNRIYNRVREDSQWILVRIVSQVFYLFKYQFRIARNIKIKNKKNKKNN